MQILIPMAGEGSRFKNSRFTAPKPFIEFFGKTMIEHVIENLGYSNDFILVMRLEHYQNYKHILDKIREHTSLDICLVTKTSEGAADTCLYASSYLDPEGPLMIANSDQWLEWNQPDFNLWFSASDLDGVIMTFDSKDPKNSFAALNEKGLVCKTAEKELIGPYATNGIYVWRRAEDFVKAATEMKNQNLRTNGEFYVCPVYNINIEWGQKIGIFHIKNHYPLGTPEDLEYFISLKENDENFQ